MGNVVDLFTGAPIPAAVDSDFVQEFTEGPLGDFLFALDGLLEAKDEATFREYMGEVKGLVRSWPT